MKKITNWFRSLFCRRGFIDLAIIKQLESNGIKPLFHSHKLNLKSLKDLKKTKGLKTLKS